jgi:hypothetical protein
MGLLRSVSDRLLPTALSQVTLTCHTHTAHPATRMRTPDLAGQARDIVLQASGGAASSAPAPADDPAGPAAHGSSGNPAPGNPAPGNPAKVARTGSAPAGTAGGAQHTHSTCAGTSASLEVGAWHMCMHLGATALACLPACLLACTCTQVWHAGQCLLAASFSSLCLRTRRCWPLPPHICAWHVIGLSLGVCARVPPIHSVTLCRTPSHPINPTCWAQGWPLLPEDALTFGVPLGRGACGLVSEGRCVKGLGPGGRGEVGGGVGGWGSMATCVIRVHATCVCFTLLPCVSSPGISPPPAGTHDSSSCGCERMPAHVDPPALAHCASRAHNRAHNGQPLVPNHPHPHPRPVAAAGCLASWQRSSAWTRATRPA